MSDLSNRILDVMEAKRIRQVDVVRELNLTSASVSNICTGKTNPSKLTIKLFCQAFHVNENWLLTGEGEMEASVDREIEIARMTSVLYQEPKGSIKYRIARGVIFMDTERLQMFYDFLKSLVEDSEE